DAAILSAAVELLIERGVEGAGMEQIAKRAGVAKVTVYRRWSSKIDLLVQAVESLREEPPRLPDTDPADLPSAVAALLPTWSEQLADRRFQTLSARVLGAGPDHPELLSAYLEHLVRPRRDRAEEILTQAREVGALPAEADIPVLVDMMTSAVIQRLLLSTVPVSAVEVADYLRALLRQVGFRFPSG
ncbi:TetR/AcrR family transcriptional regulator, partial [Stackebrandtia soli]|uniref:TetR/AcrR family transcriptional regulator n=1 Tax=Stackebrandtia soli TaxID=1892856 RepID=UPI0039E83B9A